MRDRLTELLKAMNTAPEITCPRFNKQECKGCQFENGNACDVPAREANYLLANGVIVPPCKVGDKVYEIGLGKLSGQKTIKQSKVTAIKITDKLTITLDYTTNFYDTDIGRWLFVGDNAKEEAEKALKGGVE